ncbi:MAG: DUF4173 domain-containing protein [Clostridiales bacterium]|nr:DUF4173 domain-containing protein [Clostridiales bacterium]
MNKNGNRGRELWGALLTLGLAYLYIDFIFWSGEGISVLLFAAAYCAVAGTYLNACGHPQTRKSLVWMGVILLSALSFALIDAWQLKTLNMLFLSFAAVYWTAVTCGRQISGGISLYSLAEPVKQMILLPFGNFGRLFAGIFGTADRAAAKPGAAPSGTAAPGAAAGTLNERSATESIPAAEFHDRCSGAQFTAPQPMSRRTKNVLASLVSLLVLIPVLVSVLRLLADADPAFDYLLSGLNRLPMPDLSELIANGILSIPVACWLFGLFHGNGNGRRTELLTAEQMEKSLPKLQLLPRVTVYGFLAVLTAIYALFFLAQLGYFLSAFASKLPETMTYAEYARRGFFELCSVAGINLAVLGGAWLFLDRGEKQAENGDFRPSRGLTAWTAVLCVFTLLLLVTAFSKMVMYIDCYGLTHKRIYTSCFMVFLFLVFSIILLRRFVKFPAVKIAAAAGICGFLLLNLVNVDGLIAGYNIDRVIAAEEAGQHLELDVPALFELSDGAVPVIYDRWQKTDDPQLKKQLEQAITGQIWEEHPFNEIEFRNRLSDWKEWNLQYERAKNIREKFL